MAKTSRKQSFIVPRMSSKVAVEVNILLKAFAVLKRPEVNGRLDSDGASTGTRQEFRGPSILITRVQDVRCYLGDDSGELSLSSSMNGRC